jgi:hypothetical protein
MCCPLDQRIGKFSVNEASIKDEGGVNICHVIGIYDRTPSTLADRISIFFQRLELLEKIAEIADESFHAFGFVLHRSSVVIYHTLRNLHHGAHDIEHVLHSFCFIGDLSRLLVGRFFEYRDKERTQLDYCRSVSRVCHAVAHFFATIEFLHEHQLFSLERLEKACKYASIFSALGYALWTISIIWQRCQGVENENFAADIGIHLGGFSFEAIPLTKGIGFFAPYAFQLNKAAAIAGIIHAWFVVQRLMPKDSEIIDITFVLPEENDRDNCHDHAHHLHGDCGYSVK